MKKTKSRAMTEGDLRAPNRAMLRAVGFTDEDFEKPIVGIASLWSDITPCNMHLDQLAIQARAGVMEAGGVAQTFGTITVSDGIAMGHEGMKFSLASREVIADSIELVANAQRFDGVVAIGGCDKNIPGSVMALVRLDVPGIFVYGGTIRPGRFEDRDVDIASIFEAVGAHSAGTITREQFRGIERCACPGAGACGGMYTANTMASAVEAMGLSLPGSASHAAESPEKADDTRAAGTALMHLIDRGLTPRKILTRKSFRNAIAVVMALGGSTNAVLHLLAIARTAGVRLMLEDFNRIGAKVPHLADLKPSGRYVMHDLNRAGGVQAVMKLLLEAGLLHGDALTVTGRTVAENLSAVPGLDPQQRIVSNLNRPLHATGPLVILRGNLAPEGAVAKISGLTLTTLAGPAKVFDSEETRDAGDHGGPGPQGRHGGDPLRGPEGRAGHARDALGHLGSDRERPRQGGRSDHGRTILGGDARPGGRARGARGAGRRPDRRGPQRRPHHDRYRPQGADRRPERR